MLFPIMVCTLYKRGMMYSLRILKVRVVSTINKMNSVLISAWQVFSHHKYSMYFSNEFMWKP